MNRKRKVLNTFQQNSNSSGIIGCDLTFKHVSAHYLSLHNVGYDFAIGNKQV